MKEFIDYLTERNYQNRRVAFIENGSWAATCGIQMRTELEKLKGSEFITDQVCLKSTIKEEQITDLDNVVITTAKSLNL